MNGTKIKCLILHFQNEHKGNFQAESTVLQKEKRTHTGSLSEKIGLNPKYITNIEAQSKFPSAETIDAIAEALGINPSQLFIEQGCPVNVVQFDKNAFTENLVCGISQEIKNEVIKYLEKNL